MVSCCSPPVTTKCHHNKCRFRVLFSFSFCWTMLFRCRFVLMYIASVSRFAFRARHIGWPLVTLVNDCQAVTMSGRSWWIIHLYDDDWRRTDSDGVQYSPLIIIIIVIVVDWRLTDGLTQSHRLVTCVLRRYRRSSLVWTRPSQTQTTHNN